MPQFDSKTFNAEVFGKYLERVPRVKQDKLLEAGVLRPRRALRALLGDHAGGNYITVPMLGLIDGEPLNYDGETDLTAVSTRTYAQSMVVVGRMKAWEEKDFAADITGADFMDNVAMQVAEYWDGVDEDTLLAILKGVFAMTGEGNVEFVDRHTYDVTAAAEPYVGATTLNSAIQRAAGANKGIFRVVVCHSAVSTNLENLAASPAIWAWPRGTVACCWWTTAWAWSRAITPRRRATRARLPSSPIPPRPRARR